MKTKQATKRKKCWLCGRTRSVKFFPAHNKMSRTVGTNIRRTPVQKEKKLAYYLSQAALSGRDILYDQNYQYNLLESQAATEAAIYPRCSIYCRLRNPNWSAQCQFQLNLPGQMVGRGRFQELCERVENNEKRGGCMRAVPALQGTQEVVPPHFLPRVSARQEADRVPGRIPFDEAQTCTGVHAACPCLTGPFQEPVLLWGKDHPITGIIARQGQPAHLRASIGALEAGSASR